MIRITSITLAYWVTATYQAYAQIYNFSCTCILSCDGNRKFMKTLISIESRVGHKRNLLNSVINIIWLCEISQAVKMTAFGLSRYNTYVLPEMKEGGGNYNY